MIEYWEDSFKKMQTMWGFTPSDSAILANDFFIKNKIKNILIPGIGYGRNAKIFIENGIKVTGIEISETAIELAKIDNKINIEIFKGSVTDMPFDSNLYDGIFCYSLLHLLNKNERKKFIKDCYKQLRMNAYMIFTVVSKEASMYGEGKELSNDRFKIWNGLSVFFYDENSIKKEFENFGLMEFTKIDEPIKHLVNEPPLKCYLIKCKREK